MSRVAEADRNFNVSGECVSCGTCKRVCPVGNIEMAGSRPSFRHNCEQCFACIQWCPTQAINCKRASQKHRRYHNPDITLDELAKMNKGKA